MSTPKKPMQITLTLNISDTVFLKIAKLAHDTNTTFNQQINRIVQEGISRVGETTPTPTVPTTVSTHTF
jgi:hypothetical protein